MQFRRSGQRDERRRKVLLDESPAETDMSQPATNKAGKSDAIARAYARAAVEETETRVADLIPTRPLGVVVLFLLGATAIAAVQALHTFLPDWSGTLGSEGIAAIDLAARGSLNGWLSAMLFAMSAAMAGLTYVIRRHKMDDYRGRYRMWLWAAAGLLLASVNAVAGLHHAFDALVTHLAGRMLFAQVPGWSLMAGSFFGGIMGLWLLTDMWRSRGSSAALFSAGVIYAAAAALSIFHPLAADPMLATMITALTFSLGHLTLALAMIVYARRVLLEARGLLKVKKKPPKAKIEAKAPAREEKQAGNRKVKIDPPHRQSETPTANKPEAAKPSAKITKTEPANDAQPASGDDADGDDLGPEEGSPAWHKISKAERRRLKKLRRQKAAA